MEGNSEETLQRSCRFFFRQTVH